MGKFKYMKCQGCGKPRGEVELNRKGYCWDCSMARMEQVIQQVSQQKGEYYERWADGMVRYTAGLKREGS